MNHHDKTKEELLKELEELRQENISLKSSYNKEIARYKQNEIQLQISEAQKNAILNGISANIAFVDKDLKIIWSNKTAADSVNKTPEDMIGQTCHHFWGDSSKPCEECPTLKAFVTKKSEQTTLTTPDGKIWEEKGEPIFDVDGNLIGVVEIATDVTDRKHDEDELRISEERYRLLAENSRDVIWTMKLDGTITYISPAVKQLRGFTVEEAMHQPLDKILTPDSQAIVIEYLQKLNAAFASGLPLESFRGENEYYCKDGSTLWTEVIVYPIQANDLSSVTMIGVTRDNTERKKAEDALRKSEDMLRETGRMAKLGGWELDLTTNELTWTEETYRIHEMEPDQKPLLEDGIKFYTPEARPKLQKALDLAITQGVPFDLELPFITAKGNHLWVRSFGKADLVNGRPVRLFGVFQDITERKLAEEALLMSEQKLETMLQTMVEGMVTIDLNGEITYCNKAAKQILGVNRTVLGKYFHSQEWNQVDEKGNPYPKDQLPLSVALREQRTATNVEHAIVSSDGEKKWLSVNAAPLMDGKGKLFGGIASFRDITERKMAEELLQKSQYNLNNSQRLAHLGSWEWDMISNSITFSEEFYRIFGLNTETTVINADLLIQYVHSDDRKYYLANLSKCAITGIAEPFEYRIVRPDGTVRNLYATGNVICDDNHKPIKGIGAIQDITERKKAELALRESEEKYKSILQASPDDITITDLEGRILMVSPATLHILRCKDENELIGHFLDEFIFPDDRERAKNNITLMFQGIMTGLGAYRGLRADGSIFEMEANAEFIRDANGQPNKILFIVRDISERRKVEKALLASEEKHRVLFENSPDAYLTILNGKYNDCNKAAENLLCRDREQIIGQSPDALSPEFQPDGQLSKKAAVNRMSQAIETGFISFEWVHRRFDGSDFLAEISIGVIQIDGQPALFTVMRDITKRKKIEDALRESEEKFREMANLLPQIIFETDLQGRLTYVNKQAYKIMRYDENDPVIGLSSLDFHIPEERPRAIGSIQQKLAGKTFESSEFSMKRKDGSTFPAMIYSNYYLVNGKPAGLRGLIVDISDIKKAEDSLKETNAYLENLINYANAPIIVWDSQFRISRFNHAFEFITGRTEAEVLGKSLDILFPPELSENSMALIHKTLMGERWKTVEIKIQHLDKSVRTLLWNSATLFMPDGKTPIATIAQGHDITERKVTEEALAQSRSELKAIYEFSPVMMCLVDANRKIIFANPAFTALTGTTEEQLKGGHACGVFGCINALDDVRGCGFGDNCRNCSLRVAMDDTLKNGTGHINIEYQTTLIQDGETRKVSLLGSTVLIESNNQRNLLLCLNNITERKQMEEKLVESSTRLVLATRAGGVGIWDYDIVNNILEWDDQMFALYGITKSQFGGAYEAWLAGVHPDSKAQGDAEIQLALSGEKEFDTEFKVLWPDGSVHDIRALAIILRNSSGKPLRMIGTNWDITQQKKTEAEIKQRNEELHELNATKDKFFSIIAHDLKSPFNSIMGFSELMVELIREKDYNGIEEYAQIIKKSSEHAMDLLMNLMEWARSQTGRMVFNPRYFELVVFINEIIPIFDVVAEQKGIVIKKQIPSNAPIFADLDMIHTVMRNLISNAIKFTKPGGEVIISVTEGKKQLIVMVKDNGIGIPKERVEKLFRIDENASTTGTANERGTGLGLILCKEFVEKHGGKIWVESEIGIGSTFYFTLPARMKL